MISINSNTNLLKILLKYTTAYLSCIFLRTANNYKLQVLGTLYYQY